MTTEEIVRNAQEAADQAFEDAPEKVAAILYFDYLVRMTVSKNFPREITVDLTAARKKMCACLSDEEKNTLHYINTIVEHSLKAADFS